jgi:hypothetical protein
MENAILISKAYLEIGIYQELWLFSDVRFLEVLSGG